MSETHAAEAAPKFVGRQNNAQRAESRREAMVASVAPPPEELRLRAERQAKASEMDRLERLAALIDDDTSEVVKRGILRQIAALKGEQQAFDPELVWVTIRTKGAGKISMGQHVPQVGDAHFEKGERLQLPIATARKYDDLGWIDIEEGDGRAA